jgi:hypothetical protein
VGCTARGWQKASNETGEERERANGNSGNEEQFHTTKMALGEVNGFAGLAVFSR